MTDLVPYSIIDLIHPDQSGTFSGGSSDGLSGTRITIPASPGKVSKLVGLKSLNSPSEIVIVEARIGEDYIWPDGVLDVGQFNTTMPYVPMRIGEITEERPLELFVQTMRYPSIPPMLNLMLFGEERDLDKEAIAKDQAHRDLRSGMVRLSEINGWLQNQPHHAYKPFFDNIEATLRHYTNAPEGELPSDIQAFLKPLLHPGRHEGNGIVDAFSRLLSNDAVEGLQVAKRVGVVIQRQGLGAKLLELGEEEDQAVKVPDALAHVKSSTKSRPSNFPQPPAEVKIPMPGQYLIAERDYLFRGRDIIMKGDRVEVTLNHMVLINGREVGQI